MSLSEIQNCDARLFTPLSYSNRNHRLCILPNGILTLLISDPDDKMSSCSLSVAAGSYSDPKGIPGIAHLFEHMLLAAGSTKYPVPGYYHEMITKYNGFQNAFTTGEQTTFYFEIPVLSLDGTIVFDNIVDVFASYFNDPIFNPLIINKEVYAINSEHENNISSTSKILYQATRLLANRDHPFSQFSTGNMASLRNVSAVHPKNLRSLLIKYYRENISSRTMTLCIRGPQSVNSLAKLAYSNFGKLLDKKVGLIRSLSTIKCRPYSKPRAKRNINNKELDVNNFRILEEVWKTKLNGIQVFTNEKENCDNTIFVKSNKSLTVRFVFPINFDDNKLPDKDIKLFSRIWCDLFGDESRTSCCEYFMEREWITGCFSYVSEFTIQDIGLVFELDLSNTGWKHLDNITEILISNVIPRFTRGNLQKLSKYIRDQNYIDIISFINQKKKKSPMEETSEISSILLENLKELTVVNIFKGSSILSENSSDVNTEILDDKSQDMDNWWREQAIKFQKFLADCMSPTNMRVIVHGNNPQRCGLMNNFKKKLSLDEYYEFKYQKKYINYSKFYKRYATEYKNNGSNIDYPGENSFIIPEYRNLTVLRQILMETSLKSKYSSLIPNITEHQILHLPRLVSFNSKYELWVLEDDTLNEPLTRKTIVTFELASTSINPSPRNTILLEILAQILFKIVSPELYQAVKVGYAYTIASSDRGEVTLKFSIYGFGTGIIQIMDHITAGTESILKMNSRSKSDKEMFRKGRILTRNKYKNASMENCIKSSSIGLLILLEKHMWTLEDRTDALESIDMDEFLNFCDKFLKGDNNFLTLFIQGDLSQADTINNYLDKNMTGHFSTRTDFPGSPHRVTNQPLKTVVLKPGSNYLLEHDGICDDPNNAITYFIQMGSRYDLKIRALTFFTSYLMSLTLIPELRNKRQIGYVVMSGVRELTETIGIHITIMSGSNPISIEEAIDEYLEDFESEILGTINDSIFFNEYILKYIQIIKHDPSLLDTTNGSTGETTSGPINLMNEIIPNVRVGSTEILNSYEMNRHIQFMNKIIDGEVISNKELQESQQNILEQITLTEYKNFIWEKTSTFSAKRSKVSIMINSVMSQDEIREQTLLLQLGAFFKMKGLLIESKELQDIVERTHGNPFLLMKGLLASFHNKKEGLRLCSVILKEIYNSLETASYQKLIKAPLGTIQRVSNRSFHQYLENPNKTTWKEQHPNQTNEPSTLQQRIKVPAVELPGPNAFRTMKTSLI
ncbi:similar to Saccharomyces cerevisiae YPR122W AXL1 Haploid specific endoprotease that performs one of two N-terminal cleavages during maturation of a-factor mating pheromone [Maudiozyma saulgeensis]|uniref:Similar to Saccharomyces cerevisiae YPR122W AXL1 Haploid specific endoprotease that performs one of two N-terminal cleavages during maturation of a-factor mating pheromone n=1 Tax=Maudiozyma saulgeensis TaxID=1789683 RepID=A0A1X7QXN0_9SACH|nr:similar to Saccharomyces cerevisiae YPR122W AXL1 Haploid specific endoprotease that performs one of two N-terminal cleavages during maturation of a-factor mating pheromone [Kazachstania saulgeensis]